MFLISWWWLSTAKIWHVPWLHSLFVVIQNWCYCQAGGSVGLCNSFYYNVSLHIAAMINTAPHPVILLLLLWLALEAVTIFRKNPRIWNEEYVSPTQHRILAIQCYETTEMWLMWLRNWIYNLIQFLLNWYFKLIFNSVTGKHLRMCQTCWGYKLFFSIINFHQIPTQSI